MNSAPCPYRDARAMLAQLSPEALRYITDPARGSYRGFAALHDLCDANTLLPGFAQLEALDDADEAQQERALEEVRVRGNAAMAAFNEIVLHGDKQGDRELAGNILARFRPLLAPDIRRELENCAAGQLPVGRVTRAVWQAALNGTTPTSEGWPPLAAEVPPPSENRLTELEWFPIVCRMAADHPKALRACDVDRVMTGVPAEAAERLRRWLLVQALRPETAITVEAWRQEACEGANLAAIESEVARLRARGWSREQFVEALVEMF